MCLLLNTLARVCSHAGMAVVCMLTRSSTDVLVATDAVGMGLNLTIQRVIFSSMTKFDGRTRRPLTRSEIKQIGGRAGRFGSKYPRGEVAVMRRGGALRRITKELASATQKVRAAVRAVVC